MTWEVIDTARCRRPQCAHHPDDQEVLMTVPATLSPTAVSSAADRLRSVLRADAVVTAAVGALAVLAAEPLADQVSTPTVLRVVGVALVLVGADLALLARLSGQRLALAGTVVGELALAWVVGTAVVLGLGLAEPAGAALLAAVAAVTAWFGITELRLAKAVRANR
jgi:hypothetical protein